MDAPLGTPLQNAMDSSPSNEPTGSVNHEFAAPVNQSRISVGPVVADDALSDTTDSAFGEASDVSSYTTSLMSDATNFQYENGRRYHSYREGQYVLPNDGGEQDRQDILHHVRNLTLGGALFRAPLRSSLQRVLDVGTGTGIWAIDFADQFPSTTVIGTDLSPIQPSWVPPNLQFQIEDAESTWLYNGKNPFDYIHIRDLGGSITDWAQLTRQAYQHLAGGGWIELQEFEVTLRSDDDSMRLAPHLSEYITHLHEAAEKFSKPMNVAESHKQRLIDMAFEEVKEEIYKVPSSSWPKDPQLKVIGKYNQCSLLLAVEAYSLALFTRVLGWTFERAQAFFVGVRSDLKNPQVHAYTNLYIVYGRKPVKQE